MRIVMTSLAVLALIACSKPADTTNEIVAEENMAMDENVMDANMAMPAGFQLNETTWEFTQDGKPMMETVDAGGNYIAWSGTEHVDHGTSVMKDAELDLNGRLKASELLGKSEADFTDKVAGADGGPLEIVVRTVAE